MRRNPTIEVEASGDASRCAMSWEGGELLVSISQRSRDLRDGEDEPIVRVALTIAEVQLLRDWLVSTCP